MFPDSPDAHPKLSPPHPQPLPLMPNSPPPAGAGWSMQLPAFHTGGPIAHIVAAATAPSSFHQWKAPLGLGC